MEYGQNKHLFNYRSLLKEKKKTWVWGFELPVIGQEFMKVNFEKNEVSGTFARRLRNGARSASSGRALEDFYSYIGEFAYMISHGEVIKGWSLRGHTLKKGSIEVRAFSLQGNFFKRMTFKYVSDEGKKLRLEVFSNSCG